MKSIYKIIIENSSENFKTLFLEPWGADYGMMPQDKFEIIDEEAEDDFYFHIVIEEKHILVWAEGSGSNYPIITQNGEELLCGHNRR